MEKQVRNELDLIETDSHSYASIEEQQHVKNVLNGRQREQTAVAQQQQGMMYTQTFECVLYNEQDE